ncbi:MAG: hypothetical protein H0X29_06630 [Parachlamydiaceae bacterium]|nr:hypothetical protein [Parachlamydiaceae bacterium]
MGKNKTESYSAILGRAFVRIASLTIFLLLLISPPLALNDTGWFADLRNRFIHSSLDSWFTVGLVASLGLVINGLFRSLRLQGTLTSNDMLNEIKDSQRIKGMKLKQAITEGNGLVSNPYRIVKTYDFVEVKDSGAECIVIGKHVIRQTSGYFAPMRLIGKPIFAKRVFLGTKVLDISKSEDISSNNWPTEVTVSLIFKLKNKMKDIQEILIKEDPLREITDQAQDLIRNYLREHDQISLRKDTGQLGENILLKLQEKLIHYEILRVNVLKIDGQMGPLAIDQAKQVTDAKSALIELEGVNALLEARFSIQIEWLKAALRNWIAEKDYKRQLGLRREELNTATLSELITFTKEIVVRFGDPDLASQAFQNILKFVDKTANQDVQKDKVMSSMPARISENKAAEMHQSRIGYKAFEIEQNTANVAIPSHAKFHFDGYSLLVDCSEDHPATPPRMRIVLKEGDSFELSQLDSWTPGSYLCEAVNYATFLVPIYLSGKQK